MYCNIKLSELKNQGNARHNFQTIECGQRHFAETGDNFAKQLQHLREDFSDIEDFTEYVVKNNRHDLERKMRDYGKECKSVIGPVNSCVESVNHIMGGGLHNEIGLVNDWIGHLYRSLEEQNMRHVCDDVKALINAPQSDGGVGCTPAQHHGGAYNGKHWIYFFT